MTKKFIFFILNLFLFFNIIQAQILAGDIPSGSSILSPQLSLTNNVLFKTVNGYLDIDNDGSPEFKIMLVKNRTGLDIPNYSKIVVLDSNYQICTESELVTFYNFGDTLNCNFNSSWSKDTIYTLGIYGCIFCDGPPKKNNAYFAYKNNKTAQIGWVSISFDLDDKNIVETPITLTIDKILKQNKTGNINQKKQNQILIVPNPNQGQFLIKNFNHFNNIDIYNSTGQLVFQIFNYNGSLIDLPNEMGIYFIKIYNDSNYFQLEKIVRN